MSTANASFPSGVFSSCNIQGNVQVFFAPMIKNDLALAGILAGFLLDFE